MWRWAGVLLATGCLQVKEPEAGPSCASCHGVEGERTAPPSALGGETDPSFRGVGAHAAHDGVSCSECHAVPASVDAPGHIDDPWPADLTWGPLAGASSFDVEGLTCSTYCHGATLSGGAFPNPSWVAGAGQAGCDGCHGNPPPLPHPEATSCSGCHDRPPEQHIDGKLQLFGGTVGETGTPQDTGTPDTGTTVPAGCVGCHGSGTDPAPPLDTLGRSDTSFTTVGAHQAHLSGNTLAAVIPCVTCHVVPAATNDPGHLDAAPAELVFSGLGAGSTWNGTSCSASYCHGSVSGASAPSPVWTQLDGSQGGCGGCHGMPPPDNHPASDACGNCHSATASGQSIVDPSIHVDGKVDF